MSIRMARPLAAPLVLSAVGLAMTASQAGAQVLWSSATGSAWLTAGNWTGGAVPGTSAIAQFGVNPTSAAVGVGINYSNATNNGVRNQAVAALWIASTRTNNFLIGNSTANAANTGTLTLNGTTIAGVPSTVIYHNGGTAASPTTFTIQNAVSGSPSTLTVALPAGGVIRTQTGNGLTGASFGNTINITAGLNAGAGTQVQFLGGGDATNRGGTLTLGGTASNVPSLFIGSAVNPTSMLDSGRVRISTGSSYVTGDVTVSAGSQLRLDASGASAIYGSTARTLTLYSLGPAQGSANMSTGGLRYEPGTVGAATFNPAVVLGADSGIHVEGASNTLTLASAISQAIGLPPSGAGLVKTGPGTLMLTQPSTYAGDTTISAGSIVVNSGNDRLPATGLSVATGASLILGTSAAARDQTLGTISGLGSIVGAAAAPSTLSLNGVSSFAGALGGTGAQNNLAVTLNANAELDLARAGGNTYTGDTLVSDGATLRLSNTSGSATGVGDIILGAATARLEGLGSASGALLADGVVAPGTDTLQGALRVGDTLLSNIATLAIDIASAASYDALSVVGTADLGSANLQLSLLGGFTPANDDRFWIVLNDGADALTGTFAGLPDGSLVNLAPGSTAVIHYGADFATGALTGGNDVVVIAVPAPGVAALLGGAGLLAARRRCR